MIDEETLQNLYWRQGLTLQEVGRELECSHKTVLKWMKRHRIPRQSFVHNPYGSDEDDLIRANWFKEKKEIMRLFPNRTWGSIRSHATRKLGLPRRSQRWWPDKPLELTDFERGFIVALIDGEGCFRINKTKRKEPKFQCFYGFTLTLNPLMEIGEVKKRLHVKRFQLEAEE